MRKLIVVAMILLSGATFAQGSPAISGRVESEKLTPEQRNQLRLKKLTAEIGLDASQQKEMAKIISEQTVRKEAMRAERKSLRDSKVKMTADERFKKQNEVLDHQIAMKARVKKVLTQEQYEKWEKMGHSKKQKMRAHAMKEKRKSVKKNDIRK